MSRSIVGGWEGSDGGHTAVFVLVLLWMGSRLHSVAAPHVSCWRGLSIHQFEAILSLMAINIHHGIHCGQAPHMGGLLGSGHAGGGVGPLRCYGCGPLEDAPWLLSPWLVARLDMRHLQLVLRLRLDLTVGQDGWTPLGEAWIDHLSGDNSS